MLNLVLGTILVLLGLVALSPVPNAKPTCGYNSCHPLKPGYINVHIVPHTHDDVGWLKTVDQYYYGRNNSNIQAASVQYILDSVMQSLDRNKDRRFIYVETAFFWQWWVKQNEEIRNLVHKLVNSGRLEFIGGAWSMNDEAAAHYQPIIDQFTWGLKYTLRGLIHSITITSYKLIKIEMRHPVQPVTVSYVIRKLNETFGECGRPKIGWQIDPFGHSKEMASIFAQLGYDALFFARIDLQDRHQRQNTKTTEMVWKGDDSIGKSGNIFTSVLYSHYSAPSGYCFDTKCGDDPVIDDPESTQYNVDDRVDGFLKAIEQRHSVFSTSNVLITMGDDFMYAAAEQYFHNLDKLIHYTNLRQQTNGSRYNLIYSTPSCYAKAVYDETQGLNFTTKPDDFFPYGSNNHSYWTGYFTSRPNLKRYERESNNFLQVCKQLNALNDTQYNKKVEPLMAAMGVMQHHDAVSGTEKQHVANDYARLLHKAVTECENTVFDVLSSLIGKSTSESFVTCPLRNISECALSEKKDKFIVTVYNPLSRPVSKLIRLPVEGTAYSVKDPNGEDLTVDLIPIPLPVQQIPGRNSNATVDLLFLAERVPGLGFKSFYVQKEQENRILKAGSLDDLQDNMIVSINPNTGLINQINLNNASVNINHTFGYYSGFVGNNSQDQFRSSGAYVFRPLGSLKTYPMPTPSRSQTYRGKLVTEIHSTFNEYISQVIRIVADQQNYLELDWLVGPLPINEKEGKEVVNLFQTDLSSGETFYTDSSGRQMIKRVRNFRPTWNLSLAEPIAGNYYPINSKILIKDETSGIQLAIINDRSQGGSSLNSGEIELMVHRNCFHDDSFGVGEALNETAFGKPLVTRGSHILIAAHSEQETTAEIEKDLAQKRIMDSWIFLTPTEESFQDYQKEHKLEFSGLSKPLPKRVQILSLEKWHGDSQFLLRLEHVFESNEKTKLAQPITFSLKDRFTTFDITSLKETTLGGNQWLEDNHRLEFAASNNESWSSNNENEIPNKETIITENLAELNVTMTPHQIRTFIINVKAK